MCDAGAATLKGPATIATDHTGYHSIAGFIAGLGNGDNSGADWQVLGAPAGQATVTLRYSNYVGALGGPGGVSRPHAAGDGLPGRLHARV